MYRMIEIKKEDQQYHTILWRKEPTAPLKEYQLTTVTFGTAAAPFLATRTLVHMAKSCQAEFPLASEALKKGFCVDDLIYGCETVEEALACKEQLNTVMEGASMTLRKWSSNNDVFLRTIPKDMAEKSLQNFESEAMTKALGINWHPVSDKFGFQMNCEWDDQPLTKRKLLSQASKLFDPLGWCAPVILNAKLIIQEIWTLQIGWDTIVPSSIADKWIQLRTELNEISNLEIERWIGWTKQDEMQLHGFCDASEKAYSAVVYTRVVRENKITVRIIASKTRVAPIKSKITLPRMELCGAVLLAHLMTTTQQALQINKLRTYAWSDSTVALGWLLGDPMRWKTFVANRVSEIHSTQISNWRYCPTEDNPADCASRGMMPTELMNHQLWWKGPNWLGKTEEFWPEMILSDTTSEQRTVVTNVARIERQELLLGTSSWFRTKRVLAHCLRMKNRDKIGTPLSDAELKNIEIILIKRCQQDEFPEEIDSLMKRKQISLKSKLLSFDPYIDNDGIMRVGGRLQNAMMSENNKHPIILPRNHEITNLIVEQMHKDTLHGGPQLMLTLLRKKYWILYGKRAVTDMYKDCLTCKRFRATTVQQKMGDLPNPRVTLERSFLHTGVDYCGPIEERSSKLRGAKIQKGYIAVFVCLGTRASHLELVSDCSTPAFLAAFYRFTARRGKCDTMYSDNGTNFVGPYNHLAKKEQQWLHSQNLEIINAVSNKGINWKFIPPGAPNFGGIWERNVRAVKDHLKRTLKTTRLTFEEYGTVLCLIEACLNSRPLQALTADVENVNALTPGHFLIGDALMATPQPSMLDINANRQNRWKHIQMIQQHFWNRWSQEYLNQLQQRQKWKTGSKPVNVGDLVKDERLPPKIWLLGRIAETHPGTDGRVRVVTLRTQKGQMKRPMNKICPLLTNEELENDTEESESTSEEENGKEEVLEEHEIEDLDLGSELNMEERDKPIETVTLIKKQYDLRPRQTVLTAAVIFMFMLIIGGGCGTETKEFVKVSKFQHEAGIYFEFMGKAQTVRSQWQINIRFDLMAYRKDIKRLKEIERSLMDLCVNMETLSSRGTCEDTVGLLHHQLNTIDNLNTILEYHGDEITEQKRKNRSAPLNGIGWLQHELFGVMGADQAEQIDQHFEETKKDALYTLQLLKNQTSIIDSTINLMKVTQKENNQNYEKIEEQISVLANETNIMKRKTKIITLTMYTLTFVNRVEQVQTGILDMITDLHEGRVSSHIFSPAQFKEQLELMKNHLPSGSVVPTIADTDIKAIYKIIRGSARVTRKHVMIQIRFPLVSNTEFQVWHVIPIPTQHEQNQMTIIPEVEYLMMDLKQDNFYTLTQFELNTCLQPQESMFICSMKHPLYASTSSIGACERRLLNNQMELHPTCKIKITPATDFWISLSAKNQWIYGTMKPKTLNVICKAEVQHVQLEGSGVLELEPGCEINQQGITITAESMKGTTRAFNYYPMLNLTDAVMRVGDNNTPALEMVNLTIDHSEQLDHLSTQLVKLNSQTTLHHGMHKYQFGGQIGTIIWWYRRDLTKLISKWRSQKIINDVEQSNSTIHHNSDANQTSDGLVNSHKAGRCPFRT